MKEPPKLSDITLRVTYRHRGDSRCRFEVFEPIFVYVPDV